MTDKPTLAVHKFSSCDGCQLAFLNLGPVLVELAGLVDIVHFAEAGRMAADEAVDIAFVEGSLSTPEEVARIRTVREQAKFLVTIGACATAGGIQSLRNLHDAGAWAADVYARPEYVSMLAQVRPVASEVTVDLELWGCPVDARQVLAAVRSLLFGVAPVQDHDKVCGECKRRQTVCVMVARGIPCMGPVTGTGCGAICPAFGRDCYGCFGPAENANTAALTARFRRLGLGPADTARRYLLVNNAAPAFGDAARAAGSET
jgi:sulfhydrogenase subunit delta